MQIDEENGKIIMTSNKINDHNKLVKMLIHYTVYQNDVVSVFNYRTLLIMHKVQNWLHNLKMLLI